MFECESLSSTVLNMLLLQGSSACIQTVTWLFHYKEKRENKITSNLQSNIKFIMLNFGDKYGGLMVSALVLGVSGLGSSPGRGHCVMARHCTLTVPLSTQEYIKWKAANCWGKPNKLWASGLRWTSVPSRGSRNTPSRFMLQKLQ